MFGMPNKKVSTESYKGVRDFYPEDKAIQNYIFSIMRRVSESWGFEEYDASVLEPLDLYKSKSSEEIVNEQIYSFIDRGGREVALRPEMTPTVSRMIASKIQELPAPIRWYSIPNLFRYEKPQRGRLREHWQLNVDLFGVKNPFADAEVISVASDIMKAYGAKLEDFEIKINSRSLLDDVLRKCHIPDDKRQFVYRLIDKKEKMSAGSFESSLKALVGEKSAKSLSEDLYFGEGLLSQMLDSASAQYLNQTMEILRSRGITNLIYDATITRGFDYYTGIVFEVFDTNKENSRSLFGGGRYDELVGTFINQQIPAFGFGFGDVTVKDFLITHNLLPNINPKTDLYIVVAPETKLDEVYKVARALREAGINTAVDIGDKKFGDQLKSLDKRKIPFVLPVGTEEIKNQKFTLRNARTREEKVGSIQEIVKMIKG